jgi:predicted nucleic acid-binding protein
MFTCGVIRVEVLRGAVKPAVRTELGELFNALRDIPFTAGVWDRTEALAWQLDWAGTVLPLSDLMIAACALHVGATVVSTDPHYGQVPGLTVRGTLPAMSFG